MAELRRFYKRALRSVFEIDHALHEVRSPFAVFDVPRDLDPVNARVWHQARRRIASDHKRRALIRRRAPWRYFREGGDKA